MKIKICGNMTKSSVDAAARYGADYVGFIMSKSRRQVSPEAVAAMTKDLPEQVKKVGVYVNESLDFVRETAKIAGLDIIQLHGDEDMDYIAKLSDFEIFKAVKADDDFDKFPGLTLLIDSPGGGTGKAFDWSSLDTKKIKNPYFIAGGLTPDNIAEAVKNFPDAYGFDVSSGVETGGQKDDEKIRTFIEGARRN